MRSSLASQSGQTLVMTAIALPILIGCAALALDAGYLFDYRRQMQNAADSAAIAGAMAVKLDAAITQANLEAIVRADATKNGFTHGGSLTVTVERSPSSGWTTCAPQFAYADTKTVCVVINEPRGAFLARVIGRNSFTVGAQAIANQSHGATGNLVVLKTDPGQTAVLVQGGSHLSVNGSIMIDETDPAAINTSPGSVTGDTISFAGASSTCSTCTGTKVFNVPRFADPLGDLSAPAVPATNRTCSGNGGGACQPGHYAALINLSGGTWTLADGIYYLENGFNVSGNSAVVTGTNVLIYNNAAGRIRFQSGAHVTFTGLTDPSAVGLTDDYLGLLIFQSRTNTTQMQVQDNGTQGNLNGIVYITKTVATNYSPTDYAFLYQSNSSTSAAGYTIFVLWGVNMQGTGTFTMNSNFGTGGSPLRHVSLAE